MKRFIADTSVWSQFLRRSSEIDSEVKDQLKEGIRYGRVQMLGIIRQECLWGIKDVSQWRKLRDILDGFPDLNSTTDDHILASEFFNTCRRKGIQGGAADFLICAQSHRLGIPILTLDKDFHHYSKVLPIKLVN